MCVAGRRRDQISNRGNLAANNFLSYQSVPVLEGGSFRILKLYVKAAENLTTTPVKMQSTKRPVGARCQAALGLLLMELACCMVIVVSIQIHGL